MTRVTLGVSASLFIANMCVNQNSQDLAHKYSLAAAAVEKSFYVDDCLSGAQTIPDALQLREQLQNLFAEGGFLLCKWLSNEPAVLQGLPEKLKDPHPMLIQFNDNTYTKTLGIEWNANSDHFRLTITELPPLSNVTNR